MGVYNYYGKDGTGYNTWDEMRKADKRWEQQEKQNRLLEEQNKLIREQQEREDFKARMERNRIAYQQRYEEFENNWQIDIFPLMQKAGIKDPVKYFEELQKLYNSQPEQIIPEIPKVKNITEAKNLMGIISKNVDISRNIDEYNLIMKEIRKIISPADKRIYLYIFTTFILAGGLVLLSCTTGNDILILISLIIALIISIIMIKKYKKGLKDNPKLDKQRMINEINSFIDNTNVENRKEMEQWESKIKNYEQKRLKNFNLLLEIALEKLSIAESELEEYDINYRLQFNDYPSDYEEKKKEYFNKINSSKAKKDGTEVFLDL